MPERTFLTAQWRDLALLNYEIEPDVLRAHVPTGTAIDLWDGRCFVSVVGFRFLNTRLLGVPIPFHANFLEVNLRFYVRREVEGEVRRGVVFIRKSFHGAPSPGWHEWSTTRTTSPCRCVTRWMAPPRATSGDLMALGTAWHSRALATGTSPTRRPKPRSSRSTTGDTRFRDGSTLEYQVEHPRWRVAQAAEVELACDVARLYGDEFAQALSREPASAFLADGSEIVVRRGSRLTERHA